MKIAVVLTMLGLLTLTGPAQSQELKNPFPPSSPLYRPAARFLETTLKTPALRELLQQSHNDTQIYQFSVMLLANRGLPRLDDNTLSTHLVAMSRLTDKLDTETCAAIFTGKPLNDPNALYDHFLSALAQLDQPTIDGWFDTTAEAAVAELKKKPQPQTDMTAQANALNRMMETLPADQKTRLGNALEHLDTISDAEACWANRAFLHAALQLPPPERQIMARVIAEP